MKLVEIKDIRVGQIYNYHNILYLIKDKLKDDEFITTSYYFEHSLENTVYYEEFATHYKDSILFKSCTLIGKLGITHRIEDGKLVEIPRTAEFQIDDIVKVDWKDKTDTDLDVIRAVFTSGAVTYFDPDFLYNDQIKKVGIFGVTHEFVNDLEA